MSGRLPGQVQPSAHSSLQTSWMLRLWQVVEQDLVHSLYSIPIGHLGTEHIHYGYKCDFIACNCRCNDKLTALALLQPATQEYPVGVARSSVLQQDWTVTVLWLPLVTVTRLPLTQNKEGLGRDQVGTVQKHSGRLQHTAAGQNLHKHACKIKFKEAMWSNHFNISDEIKKRFVYSSW